MADFATFRRMEGAGAHVVLIHGVGLDHHMWSAQAKALNETFTVVRYDLIGHGRTPPRQAALELDDFVAQLAALLDEEGIRRAHLVGFSLGALIAQAFALANPGRVMRLVLVSGVYHRDDDARRAVSSRLKQAERAGPASIADAALKRWFTGAYRTAHPDTVEAIASRLRANRPEGFLPAYRLFARADRPLAGKLGQIDVPVLVVTGEDDAGSSPAMARRMSAVMQKAECRILPGVRHMLPLEAADELNPMLEAFLSSEE